MSEDVPIHEEYVTSEYAEKLEWYAESHGVSRALAERTFRCHCEELEGSFRPETPGNVIRRIALQRLERAPPTDPAPDGAGDVDPGTDANRSGRNTVPGRTGPERIRQ